LFSASVIVASVESQAVRAPQLWRPRVASAESQASMKATGGRLGCSARNLALRVGAFRGLELALERHRAGSEGLD
jgi:hypothetical protein